MTFAKGDPKSPKYKKEIKIENENDHGKPEEKAGDQEEKVDHQEEQVDQQEEQVDEK